MVMANQGAAKITEEVGELIAECGALVQLLGKLDGVNGYLDVPHFDGKGALRQRLTDEMGDVTASIAFFAKKRGLSMNEIMFRAQSKLAMFENWDGEEPK